MDCPNQEPTPEERAAYQERVRRYIWRSLQLVGIEETFRRNPGSLPVILDLLPPRPSTASEG